MKMSTCRRAGRGQPGLPARLCTTGDADDRHQGQSGKRPGPAPDAAPQELADGTPKKLASDLAEIIHPDRLLTRPIDLVRFASDGSFYRLLPKAVVLADGVGEIRQLFAYSRRTGVPLTFRAAGTSLCGQAQGDGILVEVKRYWQGVQVEDRGARVRVKPGTIAARVNLELRRYGTTIGPDPASINACTIGGVLADNSSGTCCGVEHNAYHTVESLTFVLPSGTVVDTAAPGAERRFAELEPHLVEGLRGLQRAVRADAPGRPDPRQVPDEEHYRLRPECLPGL